MAENVILVKIGSQDHISQLRQEGLLYMNDLPYFQRIEDRELRGDPYDGVDEVRRGGRGNISFPDGKELAIDDWTLGIYAPDGEGTNIFCMYAFRLSAGYSPMDERNFKFGDYALVVTKTQRFVERLVSHLKSQNIPYCLGFVEYVDEDYSGDVGPFRKRRQFDYQSEWRVACKGGPGGPRTIRIGTIHDISDVIATNQVSQLVKLHS